MRTALRTGSTFFVLAWCLGSATAASEFESFKDPAAEALAEGAKILVLVDASDPFVAKTYEAAMVEALTDTWGIVALAGQSLLPPTRAYNQAELDRIIGEAFPTAILRIVLKSTDHGPVRTVDELELSLERHGDHARLWLAKATYGNAALFGSDRQENADDLSSDVLSDLRRKGLLPVKPKKTKPKK